MTPCGFAETFPVASYRPRLSGEGALVWEETTADGTVVLHEEEPGTAPLERLLLALAGVLPIEWLF